MDRVEASVYDVMTEYSGEALNGVLHLLQNRDKTVFSIVAHSVQRGERYTSVNLLVRILDDFILIEHDANNKPLYEALMQAGIPRERIILAYAGETVPEIKPTQE
jgi:hypothetical protein